MRCAAQVAGTAESLTLQAEELREAVD